MATYRIPSERSTASDTSGLSRFDTPTKTPDFTDDFQQKRTYLPRQQRGNRPASFRSMAPKPRK